MLSQRTYHSPQKPFILTIPDSSTISLKVFFPSSTERTHYLHQQLHWQLPFFFVSIRTLIAHPQRNEIIISPANVLRFFIINTTKIFSLYQQNDSIILSSNWTVAMFLKRQTSWEPIIMYKANESLFLISFNLLSIKLQISPPDEYNHPFDLQSFWSSVKAKRVLFIYISQNLYSSFQTY